jgi:hypothetical protein
LAAILVTTALQSPRPTNFPPNSQCREQLTRFADGVIRWSRQSRCEDHLHELRTWFAKTTDPHQYTHLKAAMEAQKPPRSYPPNARRAKDGHHYVPYPKRTGKYLQVVHHA